MQPYKITVVKDGYFEFITKAGLDYVCYFLSYEEYFKDNKEIGNRIYAFNLAILGDKAASKILDGRIGRTVIEVIYQFLSGLQNVVVYVCDSTDGKEMLRKRKFDQWFRKYDDGSIIKIDGHISIEGFELFNALLVHKDNPKKNKFIEAFNKLNETENNK